eukprot:tig00001437_g8741.t1
MRIDPKAASARTNRLCYVGVCIGLGVVVFLFASLRTKSTPIQRDRPFVINADEVEWGVVAKNTDIKKKQFIPKGTVPHLMMFSTATFAKGQGVPLHSHEDMHEVFYVQSGNGIFRINGVTMAVKAGHTFVAHAGDVHNVENVEDEDLVILYYGISEA